MTDLREIDRRIAVEIFNYKIRGEQTSKIRRTIFSGPYSDDPWWIVLENGDPTFIPPYSSSIEWAWRVVEKIQSECALERWPEFKSTWRCTFNRSQEWAKADTAPLAICLAALEALKYQKIEPDET